MDIQIQNYVSFTWVVSEITEREKNFCTETKPIISTSWFRESSLHSEILRSFPFQVQQLVKFFQVLQLVMFFTQRTFLYFLILYTDFHFRFVCLKVFLVSVSIESLCRAWALDAPRSRYTTLALETHLECQPRYLPLNTHTAKTLSSNAMRSRPSRQVLPAAAS